MVNQIHKRRNSSWQDLVRNERGMRNAREVWWNWRDPGNLGTSVKFRVNLAYRQIPTKSLSGKFFWLNAVYVTWIFNSPKMYKTHFISSARCVFMSPCSWVATNFSPFHFQWTPTTLKRGLLITKYNPKMPLALQSSYVTWHQSTDL